MATLDEINTKLDQVLANTNRIRFHVRMSLGCSWLAMALSGLALAWT